MLILNVILKELRVVTEVIMLDTLKKIKTIFFGLLSINFFVLMINLIKQMLFTEEKNAVYRFIEAILTEYVYWKRVTKSISIKI